MTLQPIPFVLLLLALLIELCRGASISGCKADERNALLNLKKNVEDKHSRLASWKDEDCCNWDGVSCNNVTGHVVRLDLRNPYPCSEIEIELYDAFVQCEDWSLRGELSPSMLGLKQLNYLDLSMNQFDGPIPKFVGSLHNLRYLNLSLAGFHGFIPHHLGNLSRLKYLHLNNIAWNDYDSPLAIYIDDSRWISRLTSLKHLTMTYTKFENFQNWIEALNELPNIAEIRLSFCDINVFPLSLPYVNFTNLSYLDLSYNSIGSEMIPLWLFNIESLTHIDLSGNYFRSIPDALKNLTSLEYIDFSTNQFIGALPQALKSLGKVHTLDLRDNNINGFLPNWLGELHMLEYLDLSYNGLFGCIPESLRRLVALQQLILLVNNLNGTVPESIGQLSNLVYLSLGHNSFEGVISEVHFASLAKLKVLYLHSNNLILNVSRDWIPPFKLNILRMGSCKIGPEFPRWLQTQINLSSLDLSSSHIVDFLPDWFWNVFSTHDTYILLDLSNNGITGSLPHLPKFCFQNFDLSSNFFSGPLPPTLNISGYVMDISNNSFSGPINPIICNTNLTPRMKLSRNKFSGEIPSCICLADVDHWDFSWNLFIGEIPNCWEAYGEIYLIDFSRNYLSGIIPHTLGNLTYLNSLHLNNNILSGNIPSTLRNCIELTTLDLSFNNLKGKIPIWLGENLTNLGALVLSSNNFTGNVPTNFWKLKLLQILDLSRNELSGQIPILLVNLKGLKYLNLSGNHLVGSIPNDIDLMLSLESLDISRNELFGNIPLSMSTITTLDFLNLSYNNLSGRIPSGYQLQTLTNESYIGNPQLCGFPLTQQCYSNKTINVEVLVDEVTESDYWYVSIALGFVVGFGIVWGTLFLKKKWKDAYFRYVDYVYDAIFKRKIGNEIASG